MKDSKRTREELAVSDVLKSFIEINKLQSGMNQIDIKKAWQEMMGNGVNAYTKDVVLRGSTLYVTLNSSVLRHELSLGKQKIIDLLNESLRKEVVKNLIFY